MKFNITMTIMRTIIKVIIENKTLYSFEYLGELTYRSNSCAMLTVHTQPSPHCTHFYSTKDISAPLQ